MNPISSGNALYMVPLGVIAGLDPAIQPFGWYLLDRRVSLDKLGMRARR
jgi:hypothetical protein